MNEYVQKFLEKRNAEKKEEQRKQILKLINDLRIGEREYPENSDYNRDDYPYWDPDKGKHYRYNIGEITDEEFKLLIEGKKDEPKYVEEPERSGWYTFAKVMIILGGIAFAITLIAVLADDWHRNWTPFFIVLGGYLMELGFWAIVQLLAGIKQGVDTLLQNTKK